jgi:hypothetical protein
MRTSSPRIVSRRKGEGHVIDRRRPSDLSWTESPLAYRFDGCFCQALVGRFNRFSTHDGSGRADVRFHHHPSIIDSAALEVCWRSDDLHREHMIATHQIRSATSAPPPGVRNSFRGCSSVDLANRADRSCVSRTRNKTRDQCDERNHLHLDLTRHLAKSKLRTCKCGRGVLVAEARAYRSTSPACPISSGGGFGYP